MREHALRTIKTVTYGHLALALVLTWPIGTGVQVRIANISVSLCIGVVVYAGADIPVSLCIGVVVCC